jgi:hypothetical protein
MGIAYMWVVDKRKKIHFTTILFFNYALNPEEVPGSLSAIYLSKLVNKVTNMHVEVL